MRFLVLFFVLTLSAACSSTEHTTENKVKDTYNLALFTTVEDGSVRVKANDVFLKEGIDFKVNRESGIVSIINPAFLKPGVSIEIFY